MHEDLTVADGELAFYLRWLDEVGEERIRQIDRVSARYDEQAAREFGLSALPRTRQDEVLRAPEANLRPTRNIDRHAPSSYALKHAVEDYVGYYVSEAQARTAMCILGYRGTAMDRHPRYNVSLKAWREFKELSRGIRDGRS